MQRNEKSQSLREQIKMESFFTPARIHTVATRFFGLVLSASPEQDRTVFSRVLSFTLLCSPDLETSGRQNPVASTRTRAGSSR
jgi:hypothetical protein